MRIKTDFITNSSSSSFLIVFKKGLTGKELAEALLQSAKNYISDYPDSDWIAELMDIDRDNHKKLAPKAVAEAIAKELLFEADQYGLELDTWRAYAAEYGCEDGDCLSLFMYSYLAIEEKYKNKVVVKSYN